MHVRVAERERNLLAGGKLPRQDGLHGLGRAATPRQKVAEDLIKLLPVGLIDFIVQGHSKKTVW
jgi:hypothetical protein